MISENEHQRGRAIPSFSAIQGEGHTFSRIFNEDFCDVIFHFSLTDLVFSFQLVCFNSVQVLILQGYWVSACILFHGT